MATQRVQIPVSFQYLNGSGVLVPIPAGTTLSITDRNTGNPATLFASFVGGTTITSPTTDSGGNVPGYVVEGSYAITAAANLAATPAFTGATINFEAVRGDGVENIFPGAVTSAALAAGSVSLAALATALAQALVPSGTVLDHAGSSAPAGYHLCDGSAISRTTFATLFAAIGTTYGNGDGATTFNVPNTQGRFSLGAGSGVASHTNLNDKGGSLNHVHGLGSASTTINLGTPSLTASVPGLSVPSHSHPLSTNGGAQCRAIAAAGGTEYITSGGAGPFFLTTGFSTVTGSNSGDSGTSAKGSQQSYGLVGSTDNSGGLTTGGGTASGNLNGGQQASGSLNGGQNSLTADPAYIVFNKIIKL